jgi:hypothetical protein
VIGAIPLEVWLAAGYATLLASLAACLEAVARHSQHRMQQYELAGFRYHPQIDAWKCPAGESLFVFTVILTGRLPDIAPALTPATDAA